jgi:hypothetical protein
MVVDDSQFFCPYSGIVRNSWQARRLARCWTRLRGVISVTVYYAWRKALVLYPREICMGLVRATLTATGKMMFAVHPPNPIHNAAATGRHQTFARQ